MPLELGVWRIDNGLKSVEFSSLDIESRLEDILDENISIASPNWLVIGRQVRTDYGTIIDLLALDQDANLIVIEIGVLIQRQKINKDRKSTRLNSSHVRISYAVFCLKKKKILKKTH